MTSSPITSWQIEGGKAEAVTDFIFLGAKITADSDCNHEIKDLALWKENCDIPGQHIKKPTKVHTVKALVFPVVVYGCESWTTQKAECQELMLSNCGVGEDF